MAMRRNFDRKKSYENAPEEEIFENEKGAEP